MNAARFNRHIADGRARAKRNLAALERAYHLTLTLAARHAADRFEALSTDHLVADATDPKWTPPENDQLLDPDAMAADAQKRTKVTHRATLRTVVGPALADVGIAYDVSNPLISGLIDKLGVRAQDMGAAVRGDIASAVLDAYQQGLSVPDTAAAIRTKVEEIAPARAAMLARTDLVGLANGASMAAAQIVAGADTGGEGALGYKSWLATEDERTRESHADADGQIVPLDQAFDVGGEQLSYPGDPDGSDEEVCNCRCSITYLDAAEAAGETGDSDLAMAASGESPTDAVASQGHMDASPLDTVAAVTVTVGDDSAAQAVPQSPLRWRAILAIEGRETQDNATLTRMLAVGETTWRDLPLPLGVMYETPHSDGVNAEVCGLIDTIYRDDTDFRIIWGEGAFNADEVGQRAADMIGNLSLRGVSIDPYVPEVEIFDTPSESENGVGHSLIVMKNAVICAATVCPVQAIDGAQISLIASSENPDVMPFFTETCFLLTTTVDAPLAPLVADGWAPKVEELAARLEDVAAAVATSERRRVEESASMHALVAAAVEEATVPKRLLSEIGDRLATLSDEITRKPRTVEFVRDAEGKLAGTREA